MNNMLLRALTGSFFVASIILSIWYNQWTTLVVFMTYYVLGLVEFASLFKASQTVQISKSIFIGVGVLCFVLLNSIQFGIIPHQVSFALIPLLFLVMLSELWRKKEYPLINIGIYFLGLIYLLIPFCMIIDLNFYDNDQFNLLIGMFILIWSNDTFAYLSGRAFGKTKLFERISPNKTWEGTLGGILMTLVISFIIGHFFDTNNGVYFWLISACLIAPASIFGDLLESLFKRSLNIKDSGNILPGHGGILDRFDAALFAVPFFYGWWLIYSYI